MEVRGGIENGGITALTGDYGYEPNGVVHDMTNFPEDTTLPEVGMTDVVPHDEGRNLPFFLRPRDCGRCRGMPGQELGRDFLQKA